MFAASTRRSSRAVSLFVVLLALALLAPPAVAQTAEPVIDPLPDPVPSNLGLVVEEFATFPQSHPVPTPTDPRLMRTARINYLGEMPDRSGRLYVPDLNGMLYLIDDGELHPYLDVGATFAPDFFSGQGLGSGFGFVAFHPEFRRNGKFYTVHTEFGAALSKPTTFPAQPNAGFHGVLTEWTADDPSANTFSGTHREMMRLGFTTRIHGFQQIDFNPTADRRDDDYGLLYIGVGDGGTGVSTTQPQDLSVPYGKLLRIDPLATDGVNGEYGVPDDNPFVDEDGALGEIYAYGLRNPHRFSWDAARPHRMYLGNIGQHRVESIYEVRAGDNFGWSEREGPFVFTNDDPDCHVFPLPPNDDEFGFTYPVAAYDHNPPPDAPCSDLGFAVIGGFVYRGDDVPALRGKYIFGDDVDGRLFFTESREMRRNARRMATIHQFMLYDESGQRVTMQDLAGDDRVDLRFGQDGEGELYILSKANGKIWKVVGTRQFASCDVDDVKLSGVMHERYWDPVTPENWQFPGNQVVLAEPGTERPGPRRPFEYAVLTAGPELGSVEIDGRVRIDTPVEVTNRDVILVFGYRSDTEFYYAHLSTDNTIYPHNGIFVVNNADRVRIEDQWDETRSLGAPPAIDDNQWHRARVVHCADTGEIAVYMDGSKDPLMTAVDTTFDSGRVGFGSFDNIGRLRNLKVTGTPVEP